MPTAVIVPVMFTREEVAALVGMCQNATLAEWQMKQLVSEAQRKLEEAFGQSSQPSQ